MQEMIDEGIADGIYEPASDTTLSDLKKFNNFLYRHFRKDHPDLYEEMTSSSNQPGQLYGTAKTHKFASLDDINEDNLKFRPIISQVGTQTYNAARVIGEYLKPLIHENKYIITSTTDFADIIRDQPPLAPTEEYVSYDVESLFTNVPVLDTIDYILDICRKETAHLVQKVYFQEISFKTDL